MSYTVKTGANSPSLVVELYDNYGTPAQEPVQGLDNATSITFIFKREGKLEGDPPDLREAGQYFVDPEDNTLYTGAVQYLWGPTDTTTLGAGKVNFEVDVEWTPGQIETFPSQGYFSLTVEDDLD